MLSIFKKINPFKIIKKIILWFLVLSILSVILFRFVPIPYTITMAVRKVQYWDTPDNTIYYSWKNYDEISHNMPLALVASEDQNFPTHYGFEWNSIVNAYKSNQSGGRIRGGSTISQQVAKNVFLWQGQSYFRKALEAYFTVLIEIFWSKKRIMEVYMNVAETGIRTFGVEEGSKRYFNHSADQLSTSEAAQIASVFPSPQKWNVGNSKRTAHIQRQMRLLGQDYLNSIKEVGSGK